MSKNILYIRFLLVIVAIAVVLVFINRSPQHSHGDSWVPSSFNPVGAGHMALYQTLQDLNWPVERWREPLSRLSEYGSHNVLVIARAKTGSPRVAFTEQEVDLLNAWMTKGNTLVLLGPLTDWDDTRLFLLDAGFNLPEKENKLADFFQPFSPESRLTIQAEPASGSGVDGTMILPSVPPFPVSYPKDTRVLWQQQGLPYVLDVPIGSGHLICGASASVLSNTFLDKGDNLAIILRLLQPGGKMPNHIFFEESHHGYSGAYALTRLLGHPGIGFAGMLALLGLLAFLGSSLVRFGPIVPLHQETGRSTVEFIDSIADLYMRADLRFDTMKYLFHETHQRVLHRLNLPPGASHELIASRLQQTNPALPKWKKLAQRFDSTDYVEGLPPTGWLRVARELIEIKSAMA
jgi:hypothetical protein